MVYMGYLRTDGVELVNLARMDAYTKALGLGFYKCGPKCDDLRFALKDYGWSNGNYLTPSTGEKAPWYDPAEPCSAGFAGLSILDITNIESTTIQSEVTESLRNGGWMAGRRYGTREMMVRGLLVGTDLCAVRHGFNWLVSTLRGGDICYDEERKYISYADFLPIGKLWWQIYKDTGAVAKPDNVFQANRYNLVAATDDTPENTYAKLRLDTLPKLVPAKARPVGTGELPHCGDGHKLEFFVQCPKSPDYKDVYRYMYDVFLAEGPTILSQREVEGKNCDTAGAWQEVEFRLVATDPFVWREEITLNRGREVLTYGTLPPQWVMYKNRGPLTVDDDVFQAPLVARKKHTYSGLESVIWESSRVVYAGTVMPTAVGSLLAGGGQVPGGSGDIVLRVQDPYCPPIVQYPYLDLPDPYCTTLPATDYKSIMYISDVSSLPKFSPMTFRIAVNSHDTELRGVRVSVLSGAWEQDATHPGFTIAYMPANSTLVYDGIKGVFWLLTNADPQKPTVFQWSRADHLIVRGADQDATYALEEFMCGTEVITLLEVPVAYNPINVGATVSALVRDA